MKGANLLVRALEAQGCEIVFGYPGGAIMPVYDALVGARLRHVLVRHEQGAAFAADGYARVTGRVGVCMATSGPGATNLVTGLANAFMDSVPIVAITGQVPTVLMGTDAFQEVDTIGITMPVVKHSFLVRNVNDIPQVIADAFRIACSGRPGPVVIDLPKDVAAAEANVISDACVQFERQNAADPDRRSVAAALDRLLRAERPVIYAGGGIGMATAVANFRKFADVTGIPVVSTLKGLGAMPPDAPTFLGMLGMHGTKAANLAIQQSDLLVCVGARFDDRATGKLAGFAPGADVIHMDVDASEIGKLRHADVAIVGDLSTALDALAIPLSLDSWRRTCLQLKQDHAFRYDAPGPEIYAPALLAKLSRALPEQAVVTCDVGQHQMWVAQHWRISHPSSHLTSGGLGAMGYGLPAAIGARLGRPDSDVVVVTGDGSIMMNIQELATVRRCALPIKIVLLDNAMLGLVRQWQELFFAGRYSEVDLSDNPDFVEVAHAFGMPAFRIERADEVDAAIDRLVSTRGSLFVHVRIHPEANVWPLVPPGGSNHEMLEGASCT